MAQVPTHLRLDVVISALRGIGLEPDALHLSRADHRAVGNPQDWRGVKIEPTTSDSYVLANIQGQADRAPVKLKAFAKWFEGKATLPPDAFPHAAAKRAAS